jgi:Ca-activated chloride channel homolog
MNQNDEIRRRLAGVESDEPPANLLQNIQNEIPEDFAALAAKRPTTIGARWWQVAALLVVFVGVGFFAWQASRDPLSPDFDDIAVRTEPGLAPVGGSVPEGGSVAEGQTQRPELRTTQDSAAQPSELFVDRSLQGTEAASAASPTRDRALPPAQSTMPGRDLVTQSDEIRDRAELSVHAAAPPPPPTVTSPARTEVRKQAVEERGIEGRSGGVVGGVMPQMAPVAEAITVTGSPRFAPPTSPPPPSTGGTTEPNDQPYGDVFFRTWGTNPFIDTEDDRLSTFGLDVDTGSYNVARRYLSDGHLPPAEAIRVEEFINALEYGDPAPRRENFAIRTEGGPWPYLRGERYQGLRIGIRGRDVTRAARKAATLIFTIDVSGSMAREDRLGLVKKSLHLLLDQLDRGDRIGLVVYGSRGEVLLQPTSDHDAIRRAIDRLQPGGATNAEEGLILAYDLANEHFRRDGITRVILCSDGVANVGRTGPESILARIGDAARRGIELTTVGFGMGNYNDHLMEQLANRGNGQYAYVDTLDEARRIFVENLTGTLQTIARDAKVQVDFDPRVVERYRLIGYENRDIADHRFRDDTVDAGEIGAGHTVTALYEIKLTPRASARDRIGTVYLRYKDVDSGNEVIEVSHPIRMSDLAPTWRASSESYRLAALVGTFAELLARSYWTRDVDPRLVLRELEHLNRKGVRDLREMVRAAMPMLEQLRRERE